MPKKTDDLNEPLTKASLIEFLKKNLEIRASIYRDHDGAHSVSVIIYLGEEFITETK